MLSRQFSIIASSLLLGLASPAQALPGTNLEIRGDLPFPVSDFTTTVGSVQNTYCGSAANQPGQKIGDQTLLKAYGNGDSTQRANIYYSNSLGIIVAYEGTNLSSLTSIVHDVAAVQTVPALDLGIPASNLVDAGFQSAWYATWADVKQGLYEVTAQYNSSNIVVTGHSLGAAAALFAALAIQKEFGIVDKVIAYGVPRVGDPAFANSFDQVFLGKYTGVTNGNDWVPSVPYQWMGYRHLSGMVWINPANTTSWTFYPGQENPSGPQAAGTPEYFYPGTATLYFGDHQGIYMHNSMGTVYGPCPAAAGGY
ncbi:hypothetical protein PFICI_03821 [Pestalotiopsis fici W106-1]|uniref:Fungal lipase-type domain-containing protein n=1 Tax=Pestalotiopsis fici (strain W106-1 / CGMCC3.15140) TaxID=1229662 RepID=W3XKP6_PESFW|nr:uncharacterized protein PFICI_03821 [Pestalotiopsis fici W106-1]ETS85796.1 hypothetical protein PFICI_03821 [Pestalotiopsis fici W106-1]